MTGSRLDSTTRHVSFKHASTDAHDPVPVLDDVNLAIALRSLLDSGDSHPGTASLPALSVIGA